MLSQNFALTVLQNIHDTSMSKLQKRANNLLWLDSAPHDSACAKHVADRHYEFRMFRLPPIFQMRFIYEYVTKSRGKPSWTWGMVFRSRRNGGFAYVGCTTLLAAYQPFHAIFLRVLDTHVVTLSLVQLRHSGKYCGSSPQY